jgi:DNA-directed RNA polymerase subunit beta
MDFPNLIAVQTESYLRFLREGIREAFDSISPIESELKGLAVDFGEFRLELPPDAELPEDIPQAAIQDIEAKKAKMKREHKGQKAIKAAELWSEEMCREKGQTYQCQLFAMVRLVDQNTGVVQEEEAFIADLPYMTPRASFIINGTERVIVSQLVRAPGVYFDSEPDKQNPAKILFKNKFIPTRGAWLEYMTDKNDILYASIDKKRKFPITQFLKAMDYVKSNQEIIDLFDNHPLIRNTIEHDPSLDRNEALLEVYKRLRPGEMATPDAAASYLARLYKNDQTYYLADVGRYKINKKLGLDPAKDITVLDQEDIIESVRYLLGLYDGAEGFKIDDIDHFGNRRIRTVGELVQNQFRMALVQVQRAVQDRLSTQELSELAPHSIVNARPINATIKKFFATSQHSQFMDQQNPATSITHKRRLSAIGPGGLSRERAGVDVRDVHTSHYGRMCPIETPEGPNIGLIGSLATFARINRYGFVETPYRKVSKGKVTDEIEYMTADEEENYTIAQANDLFDQKTREFMEHDPKTGALTRAERVLCRVRDSHGNFGEPGEVPPAEVNYMDVSPRQMVSVATALIPFLEHDDANRALMGSNMQRQAVPLLHPHAPYVGTGVEHRIVVDGGDVILVKHPGTVKYVQADKVVVKTRQGEDEYHIPKFQRSNQSGCFNHHPIVAVGDKVAAGDPLADCQACDKSELALGQNLTVAYMPWEGYNYEDAIILSERIVSEDLLTSIHISEYEVETRDTKLGEEEITREIPNVSDTEIADLDEEGIIRIGAHVDAGDILVGKVTPKGETELTAEERLLRAIFGEKAREVRDTSLRVPHGSGGWVIDILRFSRDAGDELPPGVNELVRIYLAQKRKIQPGDKLSGRHGNKGVISRVLPIEDMPYMADGTPIDIILNPLGVPSRMNVGQLLETHLGWAAKIGWHDDGSLCDDSVYVSTPVFDGATEEEISGAISKANDNLVAKTRARLGGYTREEFIPQLDSYGKTELFDGRTGEKFREPITVGQNYILKLGHLVDDKIHARSTGPYSMITQQPLGGKAQFGGQRFGEMEVWALYAYGAANVLQEMLTVKSDDINGRLATYEHIVKGENVPPAEIPESFKVLIKEMRALALNVEVHNSKPKRLTHRLGEDGGDTIESLLRGRDEQERSEDDAMSEIAQALKALDDGVEQPVVDLLIDDAAEAEQVVPDLEQEGGTGVAETTADQGSEE